MKKTICLALVAAMLTFSGFCGAYAASSATLSSQNLVVNGKAVDCDKYNIDGSNYFKLRDIAKLLSGTGSQFSVGWDNQKNTVSIKTGDAYVSDGSELIKAGDKSSTAKTGDAAVVINGVTSTDLTAYNIGGNNYFKLRALGTALGFIVDYDANTNAMLVQSTKTVNVSTPEAFLNAIAPNTKIVLSAGTYDLTKADKSKVSNEHVSWEAVYDGEEAVISGVNNLIISGDTDIASTLICVEPRYANVLNFSGCANIVTEKLTIGHTIQAGYCVGGVLHFYSGSRNLSVLSCDLYGCGTYGIVTDDVSGMNVSNTTIRDCTYGAICCQSSFSMNFDSCSIYDCKEFSIIDLSECGNVSFDSCIIKNNTASSEWNSFFSFRSCNDVSVNNCVISNNNMVSMIDAEGGSSISFTNNTIEDNTISYGVFAKDSDTNVTFNPAIK